MIQLHSGPNQQCEITYASAGLVLSGAGLRRTYRRPIRCSRERRSSLWRTGSEFKLKRRPRPAMGRAVVTATDSPDALLRGRKRLRVGGVECLDTRLVVAVERRDGAVLTEA